MTIRHYRFTPVVVACGKKNVDATDNKADVTCRSCVRVMEAWGLMPKQNEGVY